MSTEISALFLDQSASAIRAFADEKYCSPGESPIQPAEVNCGVMSWIAAVACHIVPGVDPIIAVGPIATVLSDAAVGGVADGLIGFGIPQFEAMLYEDRIKEGHILVAVQTENPDKSDQARAIFAAAGADDIYMMTEEPLVKNPTMSGHGKPGLAFL